MRLLIDENVPESVTDYFRSRGHEVHHVRDLSLAGSPDPIIAAIGDRMDAIVVTWNRRDFRRLAPRVSREGAARFRKLGRITFRCNEAQGRRRCVEVIDIIEGEFARAQSRPDKRLLMEIGATSVRLVI
jgi:predicted nuclease of predicted toxin-antitoxin system